MPVTKNFTGANVDPGTYDALVELAWACGSIPVDAIDGFGSYSSNPNSGGMDTGGGHCDINAVGLTDTEARTIETKARSLGFVAYFRPAVSPYTGVSYGWQRHVHLLRRDCADLSARARWQVGEYDARRDGLAVPHKDTGSRAYVGMTWAKYMEENMTEAQKQELLAAIAAIPGKTWNVPLPYDPDGAGPAKPTSAAAKSYLVMADVFANRAQFNTDTLEASAAKLSAAVAQVATADDVAALRADLAALTAKVDAALSPKA